MTIPTSMKAAVSRRYGPPEIVRIEQIPVPSPGPKQLLVRVRATTVNRTDCGYRGAKPWIIRFFSGWRRPKVDVWGTEFAGDVVGVGGEVTAFAVGDRVAGWCEGTFGAHAEYMVVDDHRLIVKIPEGRTYEQAAPSTEGSHYALSSYRTVKAQPGWDVLVHGATGAIGSAAVQIGRAMGMHVVATAPTDHVDMVKGLGADRVIDHQTTDFTRDDAQYDLVIDAVGKSSYRRCRRLLKPQGIYSSSDVGFLWHGVIWGLIGRRLKGRRQVFYGPSRDPEGIAWLKEQIVSGGFTPVLDPRRFTLEQIADAYRLAESGTKIGNLVVTV